MVSQGTLLRCFVSFRFEFRIFFFKGGTSRNVKGLVPGVGIWTRASFSGAMLNFQGVRIQL